MNIEGWRMEMQREEDMSQREREELERGRGEREEYNQVTSLVFHTIHLSNSLSFIFKKEYQMCIPGKSIFHRTKPA